MSLPILSHLIPRHQYEDVEDCQMKEEDDDDVCPEPEDEDCQEVEECREAPQYMCSQFLPPGRRSGQGRIMGQGRAPFLPPCKRITPQRIVKICKSSNWISKKTFCDYDRHMMHSTCTNRQSDLQCIEKSVINYEWFGVDPNVNKCLEVLTL